MPTLDIAHHVFNHWAYIFLGDVLLHYCQYQWFKSAMTFINKS
jgi:hypothetical protein